MITTIVFLLVSQISAAHQTPEAAAVHSLVKEFDRELERAPRGAWSLERSPAYQKLFALRTGNRSARFAPGTGKAGQIAGGEFPAKTWAITYDDGPHKTNTEKILTVLTSFKVPATFFWVAENVVKLGSVVNTVESLNHSVQNHSYTHPDLVKTTDLALGFEVSVSNQTLKDHYRVDPKFFRLPFGSGSSNARVRKKVAQEKLISVLWNVDSLDWADKDPASVAERVRKQMVQLGRGIVLFHDIQGHTADASARLFRAVQGNGFVYKTIPQVVNQLNGR